MMNMMNNVTHVTVGEALFFFFLSFLMIKIVEVFDIKYGKDGEPLVTSHWSSPSAGKKNCGVGCSSASVVELLWLKDFTKSKLRALLYFWFVMRFTELQQKTCKKISRHDVSIHRVAMNSLRVSKTAQVRIYLHRSVGSTVKPCKRF